VDALSSSRRAQAMLLASSKRALISTRTATCLPFSAGAGERAHERAVAAGAVQRLFDGEDVGVLGRLLEKPHHRIERFVGVVEEDVLLLDDLADASASRSAGGSAPPGTADAQIAAGIVVGEQHHVLQLQRAALPIDVGRGELERLGERPLQLGSRRGVDLEPHRRAAIAPAELFLNGRQQVFRFVLVDGEIPVASDAEDRGVVDGVAGEQLPAVGGDEIAEQHVGLPGQRRDRHQAGGARREPAPPASELWRTSRLRRFAVVLAQQHATLSDLLRRCRKRMAGVDRQRGERRKHVHLEMLPHRVLCSGVSVPTGTTWTPAWPRDGRRSSRQMRYCSATMAWVRSEIAGELLAGQQPIGGGVRTLDRICCFSPATRTMKNSSRLTRRWRETSAARTAAGWHPWLLQHPVMKASHDHKTGSSPEWSMVASMTGCCRRPRMPPCRCTSAEVSRHRLVHLDEFFMVRVAGLKPADPVQRRGHRRRWAAAGEQLAGISGAHPAMVAEQYRIWREDLLPSLGQAGVHVVPVGTLTPGRRTRCGSIFQVNVFPALTPLAVDPGHPFPPAQQIAQRGGALRKNDGKRRSGRSATARSRWCRFPACSPGWCRSRRCPGSLRAARRSHRRLLRELFAGYTIDHTSIFRSLATGLASTRTNRKTCCRPSGRASPARSRRGGAARDRTPRRSRAGAGARRGAKLASTDIYRQSGPLQLQDMMLLADNDPAAICASRRSAGAPAGAARRRQHLPGRRKQDILLTTHESVRSGGAVSPGGGRGPERPRHQTDAVPHSGDSPFGARSPRRGERQAGRRPGRDQARFDEATTSPGPCRLEESGVHVVYGLIGLRPTARWRWWCGARGTGSPLRPSLPGNYNPTTRGSTRPVLFTGRRRSPDDVTALFNTLTGFAEVPSWKRLAVAPLACRPASSTSSIARPSGPGGGEPARIIAKLNALVDADVIRACTPPPGRGGDDLLVRGICCLRPGVPGVRSGSA